MVNTPEDRARQMLERITGEPPQNYSSGDVIELANLIAYSINRQELLIALRNRRLDILKLGNAGRLAELDDIIDMMTHWQNLY